MWERLAKELVAPGAEYRSKPFWAWNGRLDPDELRRQIRVMQRMGMGGFFMHARVGLATPYLGDEWFACVDACIDEAKKLGMEAWLYDEDRWPSGAGGGLVTKNHAYRLRNLKIAVVDKVAWNKDVFAAYLVERVGDAAVRNVRKLAKGKPAPRRGKNDVYITAEIAVDPDNSWYNGQAYLDTMNPDAVREFIRVTHETYKKRYGKAKVFGSVVPGIFTDEPHRGRYLDGDPNDARIVARLPWTAGAVKRFAEVSGKRLLADALPELIWDVEGVDCAPARWAYHETLTQLFVGGFGKLIGDWCAKNHLRFTGHVLEEDTLKSQTHLVGAAMRFYEHMQTPGIDLLTEHWRVYDTAKQTSSAARQFGWKWRLTETNGCTGWDFPFAGHKALGDWQAAMGINLRCPHLAWYTMLAEAKRDYPASIFEQSPWWELYSKVEDYFARVQTVMTRGNEVRDLLVVHPVESMWLLTRTGWLDNDPAVEALNAVLPKLRDTLLSASIDFDYGDEALMAVHGAVRKGRDGARLVVGKAEYKAVLVPPLLTLRASTVKRLEAFRAAGGTVVFAGDAPARVDAKPSDAVKALAAKAVTVADHPGDIVAALEGCRRISVTDDAGHEIGPVLNLLREDGDAYYLFMCNTGHELVDLDGRWNEAMVRDRDLVFPRAVVNAFLDAAGSPVEFDPDANVFYAADARKTPTGWEVSTSFPRVGSRLFVFPKRENGGQKKAWKKLPRRAVAPESRREPLGAGEWDYTLSEGNVLVLDRPRRRVGTGPWLEAEDVLRTDVLVRKALGIPPRSGHMVQPWLRNASPRKGPMKRGDVSLVYHFAVDALPSGEVFLAIERPGLYRVHLNGQPVSVDAECGWWVDRSLRRVPLPVGAFHVGDNTLRLETDYDEDHPGLESVFLYGNFGVAVNGTSVRIGALPRRLRLGDWVDQGLPFYAGHVAYRMRIAPAFKAGERVVVELPEYRGVALRVSVDGRVAGVAAWAPETVDITGFLKSGRRAELAIEVIGHRRNSHGPHHIKEKWPAWTGPAEFVRHGDDDPRWVEKYQLVPCGLMGEPVLSIRRAPGGAGGKAKVPAGKKK